jgi:hypothetical protein
MQNNGNTKKTNESLHGRQTNALFAAGELGVGQK